MLSVICYLLHIICYLLSDKQTDIQGQMLSYSLTKNNSSAVVSPHMWHSQLSLFAVRFNKYLKLKHLDQANMKEGCTG